MRRGLLLATLAVSSAALFAQQTKGIKPRATADQYPAVSQQQQVTLGAARLSSEEVRRTFVSSLDKGYVVLEIGAFPKGEVQLSPQDFMLVPRGQKNVIRPADPEAIAGKLGKKESTAKDVTVSQATNVTYSAGRRDPVPPGGYDPAYPDRGWTTSSGTLVNVGPTRSPQTVSEDSKAMAAELRDKQFPAGSTDKPVAGYLYFPAPAKKDVPYDLEYRSGNTSVVIPLVAQ